jgi:hypothetical protein
MWEKSENELRGVEVAAGGFSAVVAKYVRTAVRAMLIGMVTPAGVKNETIATEKNRPIPVKIHHI